jgi:hypothetical protein
MKINYTVKLELSAEEANSLHFLIEEFEKFKEKETYYSGKEELNNLKKALEVLAKTNLWRF